MNNTKFKLKKVKHCSFFMTPLKKWPFFKLKLNIALILSLSSLFGQVNKTNNQIFGYVTFDNRPIKDVNVSLEGNKVSTVTDERGYYSIEATTGEIIVFSYVGMKDIEIVIEDITEILNIRMTEEVNVLEEALIEGKRNDKNIESNPERITKIKTMYGEIDKRKTPYSVQSLKREDLNLNAINLIDAIRGRVVFYGEEGERVKIVPYGKFLRAGPFAMWDIDGMIFEEPPYIHLNDIESVTVIKHNGATALLGNRGAGGIIVVRTKKESYPNKTDQFVNTNRKLYQNDALPYHKNTFNISLLDTISNKTELVASYEALEINYGASIGFYLDASSFFKNKKGHREFSLRILEDMERAFPSNPEVLKVLAYRYQEIGERSKAIEVYEKVLTLRSSYAQSFRDLANAYVENRQYEEAWEIYIRYLRRGFKLQAEGIERMVYNEMKYLYTRKKVEANIKETFFTRNYSELPDSDVRIVFEWNTSEAEFSLEFVHPKSDYFVFEHSFEKNKNRIKDEKMKGYSSEEFFIYELEPKDWQINITYLGNKKYDPTYLKATIYKNWGRTNQSAEIKLFQLDQYNHKMELFKFNSISW